MSEGERRKGERVKVSLPARYRVDGDPSAPERIGTIDNISNSGLLLVGGETIPHGTRLRITFDDKHGGHHEIISDVVRSQAMGGFGVAFVHVGNATLAYLRTILAAT